MFGHGPSDPALRATELFQSTGASRVLELGCGQGRDTLYLARNGFEVTAVDYSERAIKDLVERAGQVGLSNRITAQCHDVRAALPFEDAAFEACYSHMLYCMALTTVQLERLNKEVRRVLTLAGLNFYTARHTGDVHYRTGIHRGEEMWEVGGFVVHFFTQEMIRRLSGDFEIVGIDKFEEGGLPRKLFQVVLRKVKN